MNIFRTLYVDMDSFFASVEKQLDPFLRKKAKPVTSWTPKLQKQLEEMTVLLKESKDPQGVGLAATQVGIDKRFFILLDEDNVKVFINPKILEVSTKMLSDKYKNWRK